MRAMGFDRYGEADVTCLIEGPIPGPREGEVSIRVDYVRVKPSDTNARSGKNERRAIACETSHFHSSPVWMALVS